LLMLLRCAPFGFAIRQVGGFRDDTLTGRPAADEDGSQTRRYSDRACDCAHCSGSSRSRWAIQTRCEIGTRLTVPGHSHRNVARTSDAR
jgi:hypothetical protein